MNRKKNMLCDDFYCNFVDTTKIVEYFQDVVQNCDDINVEFFKFYRNFRFTVKISDKRQTDGLELLSQCAFARGKTRNFILFIHKNFLNDFLPCFGNCHCREKPSLITINENRNF